MIDITQFLRLFAGQWRTDERFLEWAAVLLQGLVDNSNTAESLPALFDLDNAVGDQLDKTGEWIGLTRYISEAQLIWFSWDVPGVGWAEGQWFNVFTPPARQNVRLDDTHYRILLRARALANQWDGTIEGAYAAWDKLFADTGFQVLIQQVAAKVPPPDGPPGAHASDDMHIIMALVGPPADLLTKTLFNGGYLPLVSAGVHVDAYVTQTISGLPLFAWGCGPQVPRPSYNFFQWGISGSGWSQGIWYSSEIPIGSMPGFVTYPPVPLAGWGIAAWGDFSVHPPYPPPSNVRADTVMNIESR